MLQRPTQTAAFWRDQFEVTAEDLDFLYDLLLDAQAPKSVKELAIALIDEYIRRENAKIEAELSKGAMYMPKETYTVGQTLVFPALDFAVAEVTDVRAGQNPEHGEFQVIAVTFADGAAREFAAGLTTPHRLNQTNGGNLLDDDALLSAEEIYEVYQEDIDETVLYALEEGDRSSAFVQVNDTWLLADMLAEVHVGHLNLAEAMIEVEGQPMGAEELMPDLGLDENVSIPMRLISLNHGLAQDKRFDQIYHQGRATWFLKRLEIAEVAKTPALLRYKPVPYNRSLLSVDLLQIEWELDDEWGESTLSSEIPSIVPNTSFTLTYPHRRYGTIPLSGRTRNFFPRHNSGVSLVTLVDGRWGTQFKGWVVHEGRYVAGLGKWMEDHGLPVGAQLTLERTGPEGEIVVDYRTRRAKREWARMATADMTAHRIDFEMNKVQVACEYDDQMIVVDNDPEGLKNLRTWIDENNVELAQVVEQVVPELTGLNPQGTVHAKSVYSAVNMLYRCPPGPIFYALISNRRFRDVGGGFFALA
ncbi:MAG: hypothetical protein H6644_14325 [Caldilineaceae bacterium]|nr:hypothetical protein [Caldilineaceae bacterium]